MEKSAQRLGQDIVRIGVNEKQSDVARLILEKGSVDKSIFFVSNLDQGGGDDGKNAYRTLNLYRELFVEQEVRCVLWLTLGEASNLPKFAPDFWAFRHRVIEFASSHGSTKTSPPVGILIWHMQDSSNSSLGLRESARSREELLSQMPNQTESMYAKAELLGELGYLYWMLGENDKALKSLSQGILLAEKDELSQIKSWLLNGLAILSYEKKEFQEASEIYTKILAKESLDGFLWVNLAAILSALGKNSQAVIHGHKGLRLSPTDARLWNTMGHLYIWMGKLDEAITFFKKAVEMAPNASSHHIALAVSYSLLGLPGESLQEIVLVRRKSADLELYLNICQEAILGNLEKALGLLKAAILNGQMTKTNVKRDPILNEILEDSLAEILL